MRHNLIFVLLFSVTVLVFGSVTESVHGQEPPSIITQANAPGWITVSWEHTGQDVYYFVIERQEAPYTESSVFLIGQSNNRTDSLTDKNLRADTTYKYHVCAVYAYNRMCSDWVSVRTLSPPPPPSGGSSGGGPPPPVRTPLATPDLTATPTSASVIVLTWGGAPNLKNVQLHREGQVVYDAKKTGYTTQHYDLLPRANTRYTYKVCFTSLDDETKCSEEVTAKGQPVAPTALTGVTVAEVKARGNPTDLTARIRTLINAQWSNTDIPGEFITLEREDRVQLDPIRIGPAWVEIERINANADPTDIMADVTTYDRELLAKRGNNYRVCAVLPALGAAGKVCSSTVSASNALRTTPAPEGVKPGGRIKLPSGTASSTFRPICETARVARERNSPAAPGLEQTCLAVEKGEALANQDPLAAELRSQQPNDSARQGFDIGMAAAEGHTAPGPGKDRTCALRPSGEQGACSIAVSFSVERNRNAVLAKRGAEIAEADPTVADARNTTTDVFYLLGFNIGLAAAEGQTQPGPGKDRIRDSLLPSLREGFNAAVTFTLERNRRK